MPVGTWIKKYFGLVEPRVGFLSDEMLAEFQKPGREVYKLLKIELPPKKETLVFSPDATALQDGNHALIGGATVHEVLDDPPSTPDETTYVRHDANDTRAESRVSFPPLPPDVLDILEVRVFCRALANANAGTNDDGSWIFAGRVNATNFFGNVANRRFFNETHRTQLICFTKSPDTLADWTPAEFNALELSIISQPDARGDLFGQRFTQVHVEVDVARARVGQYSNLTINSRSEGLFAGKVLRWGNVKYSAGGSSNAIQRPSASAVLADMDEELSEIFAGAGVDEVRRSRVTIRYVSPNVPKDKWATIFVGLLSSWKETRPHQWDCGFSMNDASLNGRVPKGKLNERDFENADPKAFDKFLQFVYGREDSEGLADEGMVPCPNVDRVRFRRLIASHRVKSVLRVFSKGNREDPPLLRTEGPTAGNALTAEYQVITPIVNGGQFTLVEFNLTGATQEEIDKFNELEISADVEGVEEIGDGSGLLITNSADQWKHFFVNKVTNDRRSGLWLPDSAAPIDLELFAETRDFQNLAGQETSRVIGGGSNAATARAELNAWAKDLNLRVFWTEDGLLGALPNPTTTLEIYKDQPWIRQGLHDVGDPSFIFDTSDLFDRIILSHIHQTNGNNFLSTIEVRDEEVKEEKADTLQAKWLPSSLPPSAP